MTVVMPPAAQTPGRARVLVVDDSALMRKFVSEILAEDPTLEVIATARDGEDALDKARKLCPDVITLDVEMPRMGGIAFLEALLPERPIPVVMLSSLTTDGAETTFACLQRGAVDFVAKPSGSISLDLKRCSEEIRAKVRGAVKARVRIGRPSVAPMMPARTEQAPAAPLASTSARGNRESAGLSGWIRPAVAEPKDKMVRRLDAATRVVAIASSTGGPAALQELLPRLSGDLNAAFLVVQHLPAGFTRSLAERMDRLSALKVREAQEGDLLERGLILIAPGGHHLELDVDGRVTLNDAPPLWGVRPAADVMMQSVAAHYGKRVLGVVLTGMGRDGALGAKAIAHAGGVCLAQDEESCIVYGMPRAAVEAGGISRVVPLSQMSEALTEQIKAHAPHEGVLERV